MADNNQNEEVQKEDRHKGKFIGGYLAPEQIAKVDAVAAKYDEAYGDTGRNRTRALRWIIDNFDTAWLSDFPKGQTSEGSTVLIN